MRRWIIFGIVIMLVFVAAANLAGPRAWASDAQAPYMTVPTRTPKPGDTPVPPTAPPTKPPPKDPTNPPRADEHACDRPADQHCDSGAVD